VLTHHSGDPLTVHALLERDTVIELRSLTGFWCGAVVALAAYVAAMFFIVFFKLFDNYVNVNDVSPRVSGTTKD